MSLSKFQDLKLVTLVFSILALVLHIVLEQFFSVKLTYDFLLIVSFSVFLAVVVICAFRFCQNCEERFFSKNGVINPFRETCAHCKKVNRVKTFNNDIRDSVPCITLLCISSDY